MMMSSRLWTAVLLFCICLLHHPRRGRAAIAEGWKNSLDIRAQVKLIDAGDEKKIDLLYYSTVIEYEEGADAIKDDELFGLAYQAYNEIIQLNQEAKAKCEGYPGVPNCVSVLASGNSVYIASSEKGPGSRKQIFQKTKNSSITQKLNDCARDLKQVDKKGEPKPHKTKGTCSEIYTLAEYVAKNGGKTPQEVNEKITHRIATWGALQGEPYLDKPADCGYALYPCRSGSSGTYGCEDLLKLLQLKTMDTTQQIYGRTRRGSKAATNGPWKEPTNTKLLRAAYDDGDLVDYVEPIVPAKAPEVPGS